MFSFGYGSAILSLSGEGARREMPTKRSRRRLAYLTAIALVGLAPTGCATMKEMQADAAPASATAPAAEVSAPNDGFVDFFEKPTSVTKPYRELGLVQSLAWGRPRETLV